MELILPNKFFYSDRKREITMEEEKSTIFKICIMTIELKENSLNPRI